MFINRRKFTWSCVVGALIVVVVYLFSNLPLSRHGAVRIASAHRMRQITHALDAYYAIYKTLPPRVLVVTTPKGPVRHSWRVALLPYLAPSEIASRYELAKSWDDASNLQVAREIDVFSVSKGKSDAAFFAVSDLQGDGLGSDAADVRIVSIPDSQILWSRPEDVTAAQVWSAIGKDPELVLTDIQGGCIIPFGKIVKTEDECRGWLGVSPISHDQRLELHRRIVESNSIPTPRKQCSKEILSGTAG